MKNRILAIATALLVASSIGAAAAQSTIELKDGTTLEGVIIREDEESYVVEIQVTRTIKDERIVPKAEVRTIRKVMPDVLAFEKIATLIPAPDLLTADQYRVSIRNVENFLKEHPNSAKAPEAREILDKLKEEADEIVAGGIKLGGAVISATDYRSNRLEIDARIQEVRIREHVNQGNFLAALRTFATFEREFRGTQPYHALKPLIIQTINSHLAAIGQQAATYENRIQQREAGLQRMDATARRVSEKAIADENTAMEARLQAERAANIGWVTADPYFKPSLDETLNFGRQELSRLSVADPQPPADTGAIFRDTLRKIRSSGDPDEIRPMIDQARSSGMPAKYLAILEAAAPSSTSP